ncbi:MAG: TldD/PmbA family protein [Methanomassiliicoccaceae archaeon]|jgi:predicted Zn-dependent protease|nr:TldD/PmbA family protein [Methanomassiliicoccaceae archaeon]
MDLSEIAVSSLRHAKDMDHAESYVVRSVIRSAYIDGGRISNIETKTDSGMCIRVANDGRLGRACVTLSDEGSAGSCARSAVRVSSFSPKNSMFRGYPSPSRSLIRTDVFDDRIDNITDDGLKEILSAVIDSCDTDIPRGLLRLSTIRSAVANSNGLLTEHRSTMMYGHFTSMFRGTKNGEGTESVHGTSLTLDPERIGKELGRKARASAEARPFRGKKKITMILPPCELGDMIMSSAGSALNGENVHYMRSPWTDKLDTKVASDVLTMTDDPGTPGPLCSAFDDEGTPSEKKVLVENGVLKSFIRDSFIGSSTGNGMRRNSTDAQNIYCSAVGIRPMNMIISAGRHTREDIISQTDHGILVEKFAWPEADPLTGRFGLEVRCGYLIRRGKVVGTVNNALMMGNMFDALADIDLIGSDGENMGCITVPTMSFSGMELAGN